MSEKKPYEKALDLFESKFLKEYLMSSNGKSYVNVLGGENYSQSYEIESRQFKNFLKASLRKQGLQLSKINFERLMEEISAQAFDSGISKEPNIRVAFEEEEVLIDLADGKGRIVVIDKSGWTISQNVDVPFLRPLHQVPLALPKRIDLNKFVEMIKKYMNFKNTEDFILVLACKVKHLIKNKAAQPILVIDGQKGSGKSTFCEHYSLMIDPTHNLISMAPKQTLDFIVLGNSSHLLSFDNMSGISAQLADLACVISTGGSFPKRKLWTDDDSLNYNMHRPLVFNGIGAQSFRSDFLERAIVIEMKTMTPENRLSQMHLREEFLKDYPYLLGGLYLMISRVLRVLPEIPVSGLPRMTEYARIGMAIEKVLKLKSGTFLRVYSRNIEDHLENSFWTDDVCCAIYNHLNKERNEQFKSNYSKPLVGPYYEVLKLLFRVGRDRSSSGKSMTTRDFSCQLKRVEPLLNIKGIVVDRFRDSDARYVHIRWQTDPSLKGQLKAPK